ncbi:MAG: DUF2318 domain-containing protein [Anaerolineales bacterium]|nr:DUF2318 domain-containing protein [Anaerolineales bacterium]
MSRKKQYSRTDARAAKRDRFVASKEQKTGGLSPVMLIGGLLLSLVTVGGIVFALTRPAPGATAAPEPSGVAVEAGTQPVTAATIGHASYPQAVAEDDVVRLPLATFDDYQAHYYTYMHENRPIEFFILKSKDGIVRAAFNACDVCFEAKKGYTQDGDVMVCNNCGRRFPANQINVVQGGCNPSPLQRTVEGDSLVIQVEDIVEGLRYF